MIDIKNMNLRKQLHYLMEHVLTGNYDVQTFCDEFIRIYNSEDGYEQLSQNEKALYSDLCKMAGRFSDVAEKLNGVNVYHNEKDILDKVKEIKWMTEK